MEHLLPAAATALQAQRALLLRLSFFFSIITRAGLIFTLFPLNMFNRLFGKPKDEPGTLSSLGKLNETLEMLERKECVLQKKIIQESEKAKGYTKSRHKRAAIQCLKRKKLLEAQVEQLGKYQLRLHDQMILLEGAKATTETVDVLRSGASAMKSFQKSMSVNDVHKAMDAVNEQIENMKQIQDALSIPIGNGLDFDEVELEAELRDLEELDLEDQLLKPKIAIPVSHLPLSPTPSHTSDVVWQSSPTQRTAKDDELGAVEEEVAL